MTQLKVRMVIAFAWFCVFFNIERLHEPFNIASFVYVVIGITGLGVCFVPAVQKVALGWLLVLSIFPVVALKLALNYPIMGAHLPVTVTEIVAVALTTLFARGIALSLADVGEAVQNGLIGHLNDVSQGFETAQDSMYREVRRARSFSRPLSMVAVSVDQRAEEPNVDRLVELIRLECIDHYVAAKTGELLGRHARDTDIIARKDGHFVAVLPEADLEEAESFASRVRECAEEELGLKLRVGTAGFPEEEVTFEMLVARAENVMTEAQPVSPPVGAAFVEQVEASVAPERKLRPVPDNGAEVDNPKTATVHTGRPAGRRRSSA